MTVIITIIIGERLKFDLIEYGYSPTSLTPQELQRKFHGKHIAFVICLSEEGEEEEIPFDQATHQYENVVGIRTKGDPDVDKVQGATLIDDPLRTETGRHFCRMLRRHRHRDDDGLHAMNVMFYRSLGMDVENDVLSEADIIKHPWLQNRKITPEINALLSNSDIGMMAHSGGHYFFKQRYDFSNSDTLTHRDSPLWNFRIGQIDTFEEWDFQRSDLRHFLSTYGIIEHIQVRRSDTGCNGRTVHSVVPVTTRASFDQWFENQIEYHVQKSGYELVDIGMLHHQDRDPFKSETGRHFIYSLAGGHAARDDADPGDVLYGKIFGTRSSLRHVLPESWAKLDNTWVRFHNSDGLWDSSMYFVHPWMLGFGEFPVCHGMRPGEFSLSPVDSSVQRYAEFLTRMAIPAFCPDRFDQFSCPDRFNHVVDILKSKEGVEFFFSLFLGDGNKKHILGMYRLGITPRRTSETKESRWKLALSLFDAPVPVTINNYKKRCFGYHTLVSKTFTEHQVRTPRRLAAVLASSVHVLSDPSEKIQRASLAKELLKCPLFAKLYPSRP